MSRPINIASNHRGQRADLSARSLLFPADEGPYFGFIRLTSSGRSQWAISNHRDNYTQVSPFRPLPTLAFIVAKDERTKRITIDLTSLGLKKAVNRAISDASAGRQPPTSGIGAILQYFEPLSLYAETLTNRNPNDRTAAELKLLVNELISDHGLYHKIGFARLCAEQDIDRLCVRQIYQRQLHRGLDELQDISSAGRSSESLNMEMAVLQASNTRFAALAKDGRLEDLQTLCEPLVRSGDYKVIYSTALLSQILQNDHIETFTYVLDIVDRTRELSADYDDLAEQNVTYDPFCVAIRLGHRATARSFTRSEAYFEGRVKPVGDGGQADARLLSGGAYVLDPLSAAVLWDQADIVKDLLTSGPVYSASVPNAWALAGGIGDSIEPRIQQLFLAYDNYHRRASPGNLDWSLGLDSLTHTQQLDSLGLSTGPLLGTSRPIGTTWPWSELGGLSDQQIGTAAFEYLPQQRERSSGRRVHYVIQRPSRSERSSLGRDILRSLSIRCSQMRNLCESLQEDSTEYANLRSHFCSTVGVWDAGLSFYRQIIYGNPSFGLVEVLYGLFLADTCMVQPQNLSRKFRKEFTQDLGRWETVIRVSERSMFRNIVRLIWNCRVEDFVDIDHTNTQPTDVIYWFLLPDDMVYGQRDLVPHQGLTLQRLQKLDDTLKAADSHNASGTGRASAEEDNGITEALGQLTRDTDSSDSDDDEEIGDDVQVNLSQPRGPSETTVQGPLEEKTAISISLIGSVAFEAVFCSILRFGHSNHKPILEALESSPPGPARSATVLETSLDFENDTEEHVIEPNAPGPEYHVARMKESVQGKRQTKAFAPLPSNASLTSPASVQQSSFDSPSASSTLESSYVSSPAFDSASATPNPYTDRRRQCPHCDKTFSCTSNLTKHCKDVHEEGQRLACRNQSCTKTVSRKAYLTVHEQKHCHYRPAE